MDYIVCQEPGKFALKQKELPQRQKGEALLEIRKIGICGTDLHAYAGNQPFFTYPRILGHELAASILEIDQHPTLKKGDNVVIMPYISCGSCIACRQHKTNCCSSMKVLGVHTDGGMQEIINLHTDMLLPAPGLSLDEMAIVEPLAIGAHALRRAQILPGEFALVIGCGPIGLGLLKLAQLTGARVIAMDLNEQRLQFASRVMGIEHVVKADSRALATISEITGNDLPTAVFDATGNRKALEAGTQYMAHGGRYILVGLSQDMLSFSHPQIHAREAAIICSRNATREDFSQVITVLNQKNFPTNPFINQRVPFHQMIDHFDDWRKPENGVIKAMVEL